VRPPAGAGGQRSSLLVGSALVAAFLALAFLTSNSADQTVTGSATWSEIAVTLLGAGACAAAVIGGARSRAWGAATVGLFAAFTAFAAMSIAWSVQPDWSWFGANQLVAYLAAFAGAAALARLAPRRWGAVAGALAVGMTLVCGWSLLAKVFPATLASANTLGRLQAPFSYWNAVGVAAAMGLPACLWAAARRDGGRIGRALSAPAITILISVCILSYSRSALLAAIVGVAAWLAFVDRRLRSTLLLAIGGLGAVPIVVWAIGSTGVSGDAIALPVQDSAGHTLGLILAATLVVVTAAGFAAVIALERRPPSAALRRRTGTGLLGIVALLPVAAVIGLAASSRGLTGEISHAWNTLTNPNGGAGFTAGRIGQLGNSRPMYWSEGLKVGAHALLGGAGELGFGIARLRYTTSSLKVDQAHSYLIQTFADLGLVGLALTVALFAAWLIAAARPLAPRHRWSALEPGAAAERRGLAAAACVVLAFGVQSALDWTWYFPGVAIPALICAGWLAGRGPLGASVGWARDRRALLSRPGAGFAVIGLAAVSLVAAWLMWQPLRSAQQLAAAETATANPLAFADARAAATSDPLSYWPLLELSALYSGLRDGAAARAELADAVHRQPSNPATWSALADYDLAHRAPRLALGELERVLTLDHSTDPAAVQARAEAVTARSAIGATPTAAPRAPAAAAATGAGRRRRARRRR
jgi:hypothetical protein